MDGDLTEIVQLVGKDSLSESDRILMECSKLIKEDFLQQNTLTQYDRYCPLYKTMAMLSVFIYFYKLAIHAIEINHTRKWIDIKAYMDDLIYKLSNMKYEDPINKEHILLKYNALRNEITERFRNFNELS